MFRWVRCSYGKRARLSSVQNLYRFEFVVFKRVLWLNVLGDIKRLPHACHMNSVVRQMWEQNTDVVMVNTGNSYEGLCEYVGGKYISYYYCPLNYR